MTKATLAQTLGSKKVLLPAVATVSLLSGAGAGFVVARKRLQAEFDEKLEAEMAEAKAYYEKHYSRLYKDEEFADPVELAEALGYEVKPAEPVEDPELKEAAKAAMVDYTKFYQSSSETPEDVKISEDKPPVGELLDDERDVNEDDVVSVSQNLFDQSVSGGHFDYNTEVALRDANPGVPYVISFEEWNESEEGFEQATLVYFEEDDVLVDNQEQIVQDVPKTVGPVSLNRFGHGSNDANIVYVRNEQLELDFEIIHDSGSYVQQVLGMNIPEEDEHPAAKGGVRKFRKHEE